MFTCHNAYNVPTARIRGRVCKTNLPSNTAFRGFGGPQGVMIGEEMIERIALSLGLTPEQVLASAWASTQSRYSLQLGRHC